MKLALLDGLPKTLHSWMRLLSAQWLGNQKWIAYDHCITDASLVTDTGIPQGDSASPLILGLLLAKGVSLVQQTCRSGKELFQLVYMDDRIIVTNDDETLDMAVKKWPEFAAYIHLLEKPSKMQKTNLTGVTGKRHMEVLGATVGLPSKYDFDRVQKHSNRLQKALYTTRRIGCLPIAQQGKVTSLCVYSKSKAAYGWINGDPPQSMTRKYNALCWKAVGKLHFAVPLLRTLLAGASIELAMSVFLTRIHALSCRMQMEQGLELYGSSRLEILVSDKLEDLGWYKMSNRWYHQVLSYDFSLSEIRHKQTWLKIAHWLRQSRRWQLYEKLHEINRHEFEDAVIPPFEESRIDLARHWSKSMPGAFPVATGAVPSPLMRYKIWDEQRACGKCKALNPSWDHVWVCLLGVQEPPSDFLLRRFPWPRSKEDYPLCKSFMEGLDYILN